MSLKSGIDVRVLCPQHKCCKSLPIRILKKEITFKHKSKDITSRLGVLNDKKYPIPIYFLINDHLFDREGIYADQNGNYPDNSLRAFVLSHAACELEKVTRWKPDILHAHDWMAAPTCGYLNAKQEKISKLKPQGSLLNHNLEHQESLIMKIFLNLDPLNTGP